MRSRTFASLAREQPRGVTDRRPHARVVARRDRRDPPLDGGPVALVEQLDAEELRAQPFHPREAVDRVAVAERLEPLAEQHERLADRRVDPALGRGGHVDEEDRRDVARVAHEADEEPIRGRAPGGEIGAGLDRRVEVDLVAVALSAHEALAGAHRLEGAADARERAAVGADDARDLLRAAVRELELAQRAPAAAEARAPEVPLVVDERLLRGRPLGDRGAGEDAGGVAGSRNQSRDVRIGNAAEVAADLVDERPQELRDLYRPGADADERGVPDGVSARPRRVRSRRRRAFRRGRGGGGAIVPLLPDGFRGRRRGVPVDDDRLKSLDEFFARRGAPGETARRGLGRTKQPLELRRRRGNAPGTRGREPVEPRGNLHGIRRVRPPPQQRLEQRDGLGRGGFCRLGDPRPASNRLEELLTRREPGAAGPRGEQLGEDRPRLAPESWETRRDARRDPRRRGRQVQPPCERRIREELEEVLEPRRPAAPAAAETSRKTGEQRDGPAAVPPDTCRERCGRTGPRRPACRAAGCAARRRTPRCGAEARPWRYRSRPPGPRRARACARRARTRTGAARWTTSRKRTPSSPRSSRRKARPPSAAIGCAASSPLPRTRRASRRPRPAGGSRRRPPRPGRRCAGKRRSARG